MPPTRPGVVAAAISRVFSPDTAVLRAEPAKPYVYALVAASSEIFPPAFNHSKKPPCLADP